MKADTILTLNVGSSSVKYSVFDKDVLVMRGLVERVTDFEKAILEIIRAIEQKKIVIHVIAHRVVHGADNTRPMFLDERAVRFLESIQHLAPLHLPPEIVGIKVCRNLFDVPNVAVFDTSFHHTMPDYAYTYAIPEDIAQKHLIRRYGFHGTSHQYVSEQAAKLLKKPITKTKIITCHLGNGCSMTAVSGGRSVDTSMGFTPLEGLVMGTRSGDIDACVALFLQKSLNKSAQDIDNLLNKESGLLGLCGLKDMRDVFAASKKPGPTGKAAKLALDVFCYRLKKYIGAYAAAMGGVDAIVFTAGIGENAWWVREAALKDMFFLDVKLDDTANKKNKTMISAPSSKVKVFVIPTDEELMMVFEARRVLRG
jgi:acetate kinase